MEIDKDKSKEKGICIIGSGQVGKTVFVEAEIAILRDRGIDLVQISESHFDVEINGVKYLQIHKEQPIYPKSRTLSMVMGFAMLYGGLNPVKKQDKKLPYINIVKEFELIEQKKSNLSAKHRAAIVAEFKRNFKPI